MLSVGEKDGVRELLKIMGDDDVMSLAMTVSNRQVSLQSREEAVHAIIEFSNNGVELMKRRKIKRELLIQYLFKERVSVDASSEKMLVAKKVLEYWGTRNINVLDLMEVEDQSQGETEAIGVFTELRDSSSCLQPHNKSWCPQQPNLLQNIPEHVQGCGATTQAGDSWISDFTNCESAVHMTLEDQAMAREFTVWFYRMLNSSNPRGQPFDVPFGTQHFFPKCTLKVAILNSNQMETYQDAEAVCMKFLQLTQQELLTFNVNLDVNGIAGMSSAYGLKIIMACGTLHKEGNPVGVFAQQFGLIRNPEREFNWYIKFTNLKLIAGSPHHQPTLLDPGTTS